MTRLCVSILVQNVASARADIAEAIEAGAEMIELRMDGLPEQSAADELERACSVPCIFTCRADTEGGHSGLTDAERVEFLRGIGHAATSYVDFELAAAKRINVHIDGQNLIQSWHDFKGRPDRLYNLLEEMNDRPAAVNKISWMPRSIRDCQEAFEILQTRSRPTIAICMEEAGAITRILAKKFGAFLTFAAVREDAKTAPGQPTVRELKILYRWDSITAATRVYGVVGSPIAHSMSPAVHNAAFGDAGVDAVYVPLLVNEGYESFKAFMETFIAGPGPLQIDGLSITIPHKENALRYLKECKCEVEIEPLARTIGAVNTIAVERSAERLLLRGRNTDFAAILDSVTHAMGIERPALHGRRVAVIGAGGTGRTATAAFASVGATVVIYNRTMDRAEALASEFNGRSGNVVPAPFGALSECCCEIYVNTTSLGMSPGVTDSPFGDRAPKLGAGQVVFDTVYNPPRTKLLSQAASAGAKTISGIEMFVRQAAAQFELWTQEPAPVDVMRSVLSQSLAATE